MTPGFMDEMLTAAEQTGWALLPDAARSAIEAAGPAPRLVAHLILVHDAAAMIVAALRRSWPMLDLDWESVAVGAAIHDIGKAFASAELTGPGKTHEPLGEAFLLEFGLAERLARHARTHGLAVDDETLVTEDLLVILADKLWRGARKSELEDRLALDLSHHSSLDYWDVYPPLLDLCELVSDRADERLSWQSLYPTRTENAGDVEGP